MVPDLTIISEDWSQTWQPTFNLKSRTQLHNLKRKNLQASYGCHDSGQCTGFERVSSCSISGLESTEPPSTSKEAVGAGVEPQIALEAGEDSSSAKRNSKLDGEVVPALEASCWSSASIDEEPVRPSRPQREGLMQPAGMPSVGDPSCLYLKLFMLIFKSISLQFRLRCRWRAARPCIFLWAF